MRKQNIGIIIIVLIIIGVLSFFLYSNYADEQDRINFNKTLKTASDLENVTDKNYVAIYDKGSMSVDEVIAFEKNDIENLHMKKEFMKHALKVIIFIKNI